MKQIVAYFISLWFFSHFLLAKSEAFHGLNFPDKEDLKNRFDEVELIVNFAEMNMSFIQKLNSLKNRDEFSKEFGILTARNGLISDVRKEGSIDADNAGCTPLLTSVSLMPRGPRVLYFPSCVLLERCGGCCYGTLLSCQPEKVEKVRLNVMKIKQMSSSSSLIRGREAQTSYMQEQKTVEEERHTKCACKCIIQEDDCDADTQDYNSNECSCDCKDKNAKTTCDRRGKTHVWDNKDCRCYCTTVFGCSSGQVFNDETCNCQSTLPSSVRSLAFDDFNG